VVADEVLHHHGFRSAGDEIEMSLIADTGRYIRASSGLASTIGSCPRESPPDFQQLHGTAPSLHLQDGTHDKVDSSLSMPCAGISEEAVGTSTPSNAAETLAANLG
jgi:hypothetical protein